MKTILKITKNDINSHLLEIIRNMFNEADQELIITVKTKKSGKRSIKPMTIDEYNKRLELSEQAVSEGKVYSQEYILNQINVWKQSTLA